MILVVRFCYSFHGYRSKPFKTYGNYHMSGGNTSIIQLFFLGYNPSAGLLSHTYSILFRVTVSNLDPDHPRFNPRLKARHVPGPADRAVGAIQCIVHFTQVLASTNFLVSPVSFTVKM